MLILIEIDINITTVTTIIISVNCSIYNIII
jgi:hypothetical protein